MLVVTGATGYLGRGLLPALSGQCRVVVAGRQPVAGYQFRPLDLTSTAGYRDAVAGATTVIHCAGLAHNRAPASDYRQVNERATMALADAALAAGAKKFIFISSLNVVPAQVSSASNKAAAYPCPDGLYEQSKWRAEQALEQLLAHSSCQLIILRPALIYDLELTANLATLAGLASKLPMSLPTAGTRSMVARIDLVQLIVNVAQDQYPVSSVQRLPVTDGECYTAARIVAALGSNRQIVMPAPLWRWIARLRDRYAKLPAGSTWRSLAGQFWCGTVPDIEGWAPSTTLETLMGRRAGRGVT